MAVCYRNGSAVYAEIYLNGSESNLGYGSNGTLQYFFRNGTGYYTGTWYGIQTRAQDKSWSKSSFQIFNRNYGQRVYYNKGPGSGRWVSARAYYKSSDSYDSSTMEYRTERTHGGSYYYSAKYKDENDESWGYGPDRKF